MNLFKLRRQEPDPDEESSIEGERALASVNKGITLQNRITNWVVMFAACALAAVLLYKYYANMYHNHKQAEAPPKDITRTVATTTLPPLTMPDPEPVKVAPPADASDTLPPLPPPANTVTTAGTAPAGSASVKSVAEVVRERRLKREIRFNLDGGTASASPAVVPMDAGVAVDGGALMMQTSTRGALHDAGANSGPKASHSASRAYLLPDPTLMMTRGRAIPCTVLPAINTTLNGIVTCVTAEDESGADNSVSLMDRGTLCTGQQGGGVMHGQTRVGIIWQRCETPQHVLVPLDSGATDSLGRPGIPGTVDNHFWDRFGSAVALSLITDVGPYLIASRQKGNNNTTVSFPTITGPQEVMTEVLKSTLNIRPTITAPQGAQVLIYLAGDIDFRDVYQLERVK